MEHLMEYQPNWNMASIPDDVLWSEVGKRNVRKRKTVGGGPPRTCECGVCNKCKMREYQANRRKLHRSI